MQKDISLLEDLRHFLDASPTAWHAIAVITDRLKKSGFEELKENQDWTIQKGKAYFVQRNDSSLCAFIAPNDNLQRLRILASHTDSPALKLKPNPEIHKNKMISFGVEVYGGPLLNSWLNRDLGIAGRIVYKDKQDHFQTALVQLDRHPLIIPQLAIHLDREVNEKGLILNKQEHLYALAALESNLTDFNPSEKNAYLKKMISEVIHFKELIDFDLFLVPLEKARYIGYQQQLLASYRIDSLTSVHAILTALLNELQPHETDMKMAIFWDNEEVGSYTAQGADSPFFNQTLERIHLALNIQREQQFSIINQSTCISVDLAHALHPNHSDKHDAQHQPLLGEGVVLKYNAQCKYATNIISSLPIHHAANVKHIPLQKFVSRNDMPCGSTIGPIQASRSGINTVDIGCPQLSMHSCREILSTQDQAWLYELLSSLLNKEKWPQLIHQSHL